MGGSVVAVGERLVGAAVSAHVAVPVVSETVEHAHVGFNLPIQTSQAGIVLEDCGIGSWDVAGKLRLRCKRYVQGLTNAFPGSVEEEFVFDDRTADISAELIALVVRVL